MGRIVKALGTSLLIADTLMAPAIVRRLPDRRVWKQEGFLNYLVRSWRRFISGSTALSTNCLAEWGLAQSRHLLHQSRYCHTSLLGGKAVLCSSRFPGRPTPPGKWAITWLRQFPTVSGETFRPM